MTQDFLYILVALLLVAANGFFVAAEFAIVKLRGTRAEELALTGGLRGRILLSVKRRLDAYLSACQLGITLASLGLGWIGEPAFAHLIEPVVAAMGVESERALHGIAFAAAFSIISFLHIVLGELAPKSLAIRRPEPVSLWVGVPLWAFYWAMYPFIKLLNGSAILILKGFGVEIVEEMTDEPHSPGELRSILAASHVHGEMDPVAADMASHAIDLVEVTAGELMRPDSDMVALEEGDSLASARDQVVRHRFSRYPVYRGIRDNIVGMFHAKDLLLLEKEADRGHGEGADPAAQTVASAMREPLIVTEDTPVVELVRSLQEEGTHMAVVEDDNGVIVGFVTLDHVLEALMGRMQDEFTHSSPAWRRLEDGSLVGDGMLSLYSLSQRLERSVDVEEVNSIGGLVMRELDRVPRVGDQIEAEGLRIRVLRMDGARVRRVRVEDLAGSEDGEGDT